MINLNKNVKFLIQFVSKIPRMNLTIKSFFTSPALYNENFTETVDNLPNSLELVKLFLIEHSYIKYCIKYKSFYIYNKNNNNIWTFIEEREVKHFFLDFLELKFPKDHENFYENYSNNINKVVLLIKKNTKFSLPESIKNANKDGILLPFKNGVLNTWTL